MTHLESGDVGSAIRRVNGDYVNVAQWPTPDEGALPPERRSEYFSRKKAVELYLLGASAEGIRSVSSLSLKQVYRLIKERCLEIHSDGRPWGWRGLIPYQRLRAYTRCKKVEVDNFGAGAVGAMQLIFNLHPDLREAFNKRIIKTPSGRQLEEINRGKRRHHAWLIEKLRALGYEARKEWPFNTQSRGYYSVCRYVNSVLAENPKALAALTGGPDLVKKLSTGSGVNRPVLDFMQRVEMDAHKLDGYFCVAIPQPDGGHKDKIIHRLWVIVILEVVSRAVLGYYLSMRREVSKDDVLRAIKRALTPWSPRPVTFGDSPYLPGAGLLSALGSEFTALCWDETSVDGALAETCQHVRDVLRDAVGSALLSPETSFAKRRSKDDRPFIEAFFRNLAGGGFQRMSNTTGAKPADKKVKDPALVALNSRFQYEYAHELLDVLIANYNATPHKGIAGRIPIEYADFLLKHGNKKYRYLESNVLDYLLSTRKLCTVRGGAKEGRAPYVEFYRARYTNEKLQGRHDLVGSRIWVINHLEDDGRVALASTLDGTSLGTLRAAPPWHHSPHSLSLRAAICQLIAQKKLSLPAGGDAVEGFIGYSERQTSKKLPVHPAYLEARRIMIAAAEQSIGATMLERAKLRAQESSNTDNSKTTKQKKSPNLDHPESNKNKNDDISASPSLPPRRMAATR